VQLGVNPAQYGTPDRPEKFHPNSRRRCETREAASGLLKFIIIINVAAVLDPDKFSRSRIEWMALKKAKGMVNKKTPARFGSFIGVGKLK